LEGCGAGACDPWPAASLLGVVGVAPSNGIGAGAAGAGWFCNCSSTSLDAPLRVGETIDSSSDRNRKVPPQIQLILVSRLAA